MNQIRSMINRHLKYYYQWDYLVFLLLTALSVWSGKSTVFYVIYFFWWNELIRILIDGIFFRKNKNAVLGSGKNASVFSSVIQMGIYFVFIVVFFGFMANWNNQELILMNMSILFFQNIYFNINLVFVAIERVLLHRSQRPTRVSFGTFTPNMIILHISIIVGAALMFFVVRNFPETFTPSNLWGSVIIILPFLLLKVAIQFKLNLSGKNQGDS